MDVDPATGNLDPQKIEEAITPKTTAIMPVHVYGNPCDIDAIQEIADRYGLAVIYDAAHAFNVKVNGRTIRDAGDMNTLSFHATKTYRSNRPRAHRQTHEGRSNRPRVRPGRHERMQT